MRLHAYCILGIPIDLLCAHAGDSESYNEGGEWFEAVRAKHPTSASHAFPTMEHGFMPRGDLAAEGVRGEVEKSLALVLEFFNKH